MSSRRKEKEAELLTGKRHHYPDFLDNSGAFKITGTLRFLDVLSVSFPERADRDAGSPLYLKSHSFQLTVRLEMTDASRINTGISGLSA